MATWCDLEGGEVDGEGMAGLRAEDGQRIEQPDVGPGRLLGALAEPGQGERVLVDRPGPAGGPREKAALDESPAPTGMVLVTFTAPPDGGRARRDQGGRQCGLRREAAECGARPGDLPGLGELVAGHADQEAARPWG